MNQGLGPSENLGNDHQDNSEDMNNPRVSNNPENIDNQGVTPHVPITPVRLVWDVSVTLSANLFLVLGNLQHGVDLN